MDFPKQVFAPSDGKCLLSELHKTCCIPGTSTVKMSWQKAKRESKDDSVGDMKHGRKKRERLFKKRFSALNFFSGPSKSKLNPYIPPFPHKPSSHTL
ncbi:hypothetical protein UY3_09535 [Chelonia mydas]|uniref:Uncharacterized protein n=1 Tax=Chelonia mydas TaxID=8469 RepID=M7BCM7_CHEMY|nr:hypothetical protein UY3_09535 [Chelonia mydas]